MATIGVAYFVGTELGIRRQLRPYLAGPRVVTVTMSEDEYRIESEVGGTARTWSTFESVRRVGQFWILRISNAAAMSVPAAALDDAQTTAFQDLVRRKGLLAN